MTKELEKLIVETKSRLKVLSALSSDLMAKLDDEALNDQQKLHACQFCFAATDAISVIINFNNKHPNIEENEASEVADEDSPSN